MPTFFEPLFQLADRGDVKILLDQDWPVNVCEPTELGQELLALSPPHPSPTKLEYRPVDPKLPVRCGRRARGKIAAGQSLPWQTVLNAARLD